MNKTIDVFFSKSPFTLNVKNSDGKYTLQSKQTTVDELITYILDNYGRSMKRGFEELLAEIRDNKVEKIPAEVEEGESIYMRYSRREFVSEFVYQRPASYKAGDVELVKRVYVDEWKARHTGYLVTADDNNVKVLYPHVKDRYGRREAPPVFVETQLYYAAAPMVDYRKVIAAPILEYWETIEPRAPKPSTLANIYMMEP